MSYATGSIRSLAMDKLAAVGIATDPRGLVTASEFRTRESLVGHAVISASRIHGVQFSSIVSIGDGTWDQKTARSLRLAFMAVGTRWTDMIKTGSAVVDFRDTIGSLAVLTRVEAHSHQLRSGEDPKWLRECRYFDRDSSILSEGAPLSSPR